jgi:hypothetical protein
MFGWLYDYAPLYGGMQNLTSSQARGKRGAVSFLQSLWLACLTRPGPCEKRTTHAYPCRDPSITPFLFQPPGNTGLAMSRSGERERESTERARQPRPLRRRGEAPPVSSCRHRRTDKTYIPSISTAPRQRRRQNRTQFIQRLLLLVTGKRIVCRALRGHKNMDRLHELNNV